MMNSALKVIILAIAIVIGSVVYQLNQPAPLDEPEETWWGSESPSVDDKSIIPFKINVSDEVLEDLKLRLANARLVPPLVGIQQQYGMNTNLLKEIVDFWRNKYDWKERELFLNQFPQFKTKIQGLDIHYIHVKPKNVPDGVRVLPLLLLHGWPGSVREFYEIIPLLTTVQEDQDFVFEAIVPSLPGYGFSQAAVRPGLGSKQAALIFKNLMVRLGFEFFYIHGGDWGSVIATDMAVYFPDIVKGIHSNACFTNSYLSKAIILMGSFWPSLVVDDVHRHRWYPISEFFFGILEEFGYVHIQATKPDTVGVSLNDSPVGLAAYILEKFISWTNPEWIRREGGGLLEKYSYTQLLDNIMIYWISGSITTSMRFYAENFNKKQNVFSDRTQVFVPSACALFEHELIYQPEYMMKDRYVKLVQALKYSGGHFAALEAPEDLALDLRLAVSKFEKLREHL